MSLSYIQKTLLPELMSNKGKIFNKIAFFDVDGTLMEGNSFFSIVDFYRDNQLLSPGAYAKIADLKTAYSQKKVTQDEAVQQAAVLLSEGLKGKNVTDVKKVTRDFFFKIWMKKFMDTAEVAVEHLKNEGYAVILVSGSNSEIIDEIAKHLNKSDKKKKVYSLAAYIPKTGKTNTYTGEKPDFYMTSDHKLKIVKSIIDSIQPEHTIGAGDSLGDVFAGLCNDAILVTTKGKLRDPELLTEVQKMTKKTPEVVDENNTFLQAVKKLAKPKIPYRHSSYI